MKRFYSTKPSQLKSAICIVGQTASSVSRTINPEFELKNLVQKGVQPLKQNFEARNLCPVQLLGCSYGKYFMILALFMQTKVIFSMVYITFEVIETSRK